MRRICSKHKSNYRTGCIECQHIVMDGLIDVEKQNEELIKNTDALISWIIDNNHKYDILYDDDLHEILYDIKQKTIEEILQEYE
jgi:predicted AAA+ superfamily ATPase